MFTNGMKPMQHVVDTGKLVAEEWLTPEQAAEIARRSRETMVALAVNAILCAGIVAATLGLSFWLADAMAVSAAGAIFLAIGAFVLLQGSNLYRMLGNASAMIGAGMLIGGAAIELVDKYRDVADPIMILGGAIVGALALFVHSKRRAQFGFAAGSVLLMGGAMHLIGVALAFEGMSGFAPIIINGYAALLLVAAGVLLNVRLVTALAIVPFAQMLDTGTDYFHATYVFYSSEPTLTVLQMAALIGLCVWASTRLSDRFGRHAGILAIMAAVVGNLAFLVGSLWGDHVGASLFETPAWDSTLSYGENMTAITIFRAQFFEISENVFSVVWAVLLAGAAFWAAHANRRGLFNAAMTFGAIHAYTQAFETMSDQPLAYAIGGLAAIPLAWGMWRLNLAIAARQSTFQAG